MAMTDDEIDAQLAALGFERGWVTVGVLTEEWLDPRGPRRSQIASDEAYFAELGSRASGRPRRCSSRRCTST